MKALAPLRMLERMRSYGASQRIEWLKVFPDELWIMIITSTPTETLKALALTCHELSGECRRELARRKAQELEQLRLLEFVFHTKVICHSCVSQHNCPSPMQLAWNDMRWELWPGRSRLALGGEKCKLNNSLIRLSKKNDLDWWRGHLVMRAHRFHEVHGVPLESLSRITIRIRGFWISSTDAVIHNDHLLLKVVGYRMLVMSEDITRHMPRCKHLKYSQAMHSTVKTFRDKSLLADETQHPPDLLYRCQYCPYEFRLKVGMAIEATGEAARTARRYAERQQKKREKLNEPGDILMATISGYLDLGKCIEPTEPQWSALSGAGSPGSVSPEAYERFHRPTIESRYEHEASIQAGVRKEQIVPLDSETTVVGL